MSIQPHEFSQHFGAGNDGNLARSSLDNFGIVGADRGGADDDICARNVLGAVAFEDGCPHRLQSIGYGGALQVAAGDEKVLPQRQQHFSYAAHSYAANPDEVNMSDSSKKHLVCHWSLVTCHSSFVIAMPQMTND